jgi:hypothetical protein
MMPAYEWQSDDTLIVRLATEHTATSTLRTKLNREFRVGLSQMAVDSPDDHFVTLTFRRHAEVPEPWNNGNAEAKARYQRHMAIVVCAVLKRIGLTLAA